MVLRWKNRNGDGVIVECTIWIDDGLISVSFSVRLSCGRRRLPHFARAQLGVVRMPSDFEVGVGVVFVGYRAQGDAVAGQQFFPIFMGSDVGIGIGVVGFDAII